MTDIWHSLARNLNEAGIRRIISLFDNPDRFHDFFAETAGMLLNFSKSNIDREAFELLLGLAHAADISSKRDAMLRSDGINSTENRAVLLPALRSRVSDLSVQRRFGPCFLRGDRTMTISKELLDELLKGCERPEDLLGDARPPLRQPRRHSALLGLGSGLHPLRGSLWRAIARLRRPDRGLATPATGQIVTRNAHNKIGAAPSDSPHTKSQSGGIHQLL